MYKCLDSGAEFAITRTLETRCTSVDCTTAQLASDVPSTRDSGAILPFADRGTSTTRFQFVGGVKALKIATKTARAGNRTRGETHGTKLSVARCVRCTLCLRTLPIDGGLGRRLLTCAAEVGGGPIPVFFTLRGRRGRVVRGAAVVLVAP